jgi:putative ABC transport system permease protein
VPLVNRFFADLVHGARVLRKSPAFSLTVIAVLALGIGANSAVFSVVDAVLLRALPFPAADRLVMVWEKNPSLGEKIANRVPVALSNFREWQKRATQFESIGGYEEANFNLTSGTEPERVDGARASANFFHVFGVAARLGATFESAATNPNTEHVALLSDAFFQSHFGGAPGLLGRTLTMNDIVYTIVGVLPPDFRLPATREGQNQSKPQVWVPYAQADVANTGEFNRRKMQVFARLRDGVSLAQARAEMNTVSARMAAENPTENAGFSANVYPVYLEDVGQEQRRDLLVLFATVGFVLLIAIANVATLMLTRTAARQHEMAIRKALGASRTRLIAQLLAESLLLSGAGALLGLALAHFGIKGLLALQPAAINRPEQIHLGLPVFLFTAAVSILVAGFFGIFPALQAARTEVNASLGQGRGAQSVASSGRARQLLVVAEVALACVLLVGAGFMMKSLFAVLNVAPGFTAEHLLTMKFSLPESHYANNEQIAAFCRQALEKVSTTPGVKYASFSDGLPLTRLRMTRYLVEGQTPPARGSEPTADMRGIFNPDYFPTMGIRLVAGRNFTAAELAEKTPVLVINQSLAQRLWPNESAIGKHLRNVPSKATTPPVVSTVIGVVQDTHQLSLEEGARAEITKPMLDYTQLTLAARTVGDPGALIPAIKRQIWSVDHNIPMFEIATMEQVLRDSTSDRRFQSFLITAFAGLALLLASVGLYGVLSSLVTQRTHEIGIRMALGAQKGDVLRLVMLEGARMVLAGIAIGVAAGFTLSRYLSSLFFGVGPDNATTYLEAGFLMLAIALLACFLPAWRALRVNPMIALRYE